MHRLLRGLEKSGGVLRAGGQRPLSTNVVAATAARSQNLMARQGTASHPFANPRNLSSAAAHAVASGGIGQEHLSAIVNAPDRPPSALERANLAEITPGHALSVLQIYGAEPTNYIRHADFVKLCESARPGKMRDGKIIATALKEFRKNNRFNVHIVGASAAIEGMLRALTPTWKVQDGRPRLRAATFVAQQIADDATGLYFAVETVMVNKVLEELHKGLTEMVESGINVRVDKIGEKVAEEGEESEEPEEGEEANPNEKTLREALQATEDLIQLLTKRCSSPQQQMKKRARRKYLKALRVRTGPKMTTFQSAANIAVLIGGEEVAREKISLPSWWCEEDHARLRGMIDGAVAAAPAAEELAAATEDDDEAPAAEESEGEDVEDAGEESDESVEEGGNASEEGDSAESESDEEKKD
ncbi:hypothetical protein ACHAXT_006629 [Thalassiosira profunda]